MADRYASLKQGLVGAWIPSISGSGLLLPDLSGRGNNGTLTNMSPDDWVSGQYGRALDFDGVNDYVTATVTNFVQYANPFCVSAFVKLNALGSQRNVVSTWQPSSSSGPGWQLAIDSTDKPSLLYVDSLGSNYIFFTADKPLTTNITHVCFSTTGSTNVKAFVDGVEQSVTSTTFGTGNPGTLTSNQLWIGARNLTGSQTFLNGQVDDVRAYNRALTESEIKLLASEPGIGFKPAKKLSRFSQRFTYNPPKARNYSVVRVKETDYGTLRQGLVGAWCPSLPNGGSGNTLPDVSGRGNHGTLTNMSPDDWVSGQYGRALDFDGVNDHVVASHQPFASLQQGTISGWVNTSNDVNQCLFALANTSNSNQFAFFGYGGDQTGTLTNELIYFIIRGFAGTDLATFGYATSTRTELIDGSWHHIAIVVNGTSASSIYLDGVSRSISVSNQYPTSNQGQFFGDLTGLNKCLIAAYQLGADLGGYASGRQDDIRIYNRALTESEIRLLASRPGIGLRQESHRNTFYQFPSGARRKRILTGMP